MVLGARAPLRQSDALLPDATGEVADLAAEIDGVTSMSKHMLEASGGQRSHGLYVAIESEMATGSTDARDPRTPSWPARSGASAGACTTCS